MFNSGTIVEPSHFESISKKSLFLRSFSNKPLLFNALCKFDEKSIVDSSVLLPFQLKTTVFFSLLYEISQTPPALGIPFQLSVSGSDFLCVIPAIVTESKACQSSFFCVSSTSLTISVLYPVFPIAMISVQAVRMLKRSRDSRLSSMYP